MAISEIHAAWGSCKVVPAASSRCYSSNRNNMRRPQSPLTLGSAHASLLLLAAMLLLMLPSCLALPSDSTTILPFEEATTEIPPQQPAIEVNSPKTSPSTVAPVNTSLVEIEPVKTDAAEIADEFIDTSFTSLAGEGLEQGIRNEVKSIVELDIEADSSGSLVDHEQKITNSHDEHTAQGVREPKALDAEAAIEEEDVKPTHAVVENDKLSVEAEEGAEAEEKTEQPIEADVNNDKSTKETEPEKEKESEKPTDTVVHVDDSNIKTATDKSPTLNEQVDQESPNPPLPSLTSDLASVIFDENRAITEQPITNTNRLALEHEHENVHLTEELPKPAFEVTKHQVTKKQGVEDLLPLEVVEEVADKEEAPKPVTGTEPESFPATQLKETEITPKGTTEPSTHLNEIEENIIESDAIDKEVQPIASSSAEPEHVEPTEASVGVVAPVEEAAVESNEPVIAASSETPVESLTPTEASIAQNADPEKTETEIEAEGEVESKPVSEESTAVEGEVNISESSSTAAPAEPEVVDKSDSDSDESEQQTKQPDSESVEKDSSEESDELTGDEPKAKAEDSTATPLVSYPPHNAGQTFDSNLADERSAYLSLASSGRSTLIIALCSGTAVIFIVTSLVIFVLSFQRQHGTLDIEMQEQRLGKDNLDEEDAQMKLLDVDLSTPVIIAMGNEETDECL
ncbi:histone-lysine N-methyltransferase SETDB1-A isoform X2 [Drosophila innubila]|uniref:histone-lysine N-methyltransferase SETDB1-A isoform X2 n=1 Tax=Drosophila innubila TaxID=198719 RepID=UPI00148E0062|nr:histone-lysine N-methyltransferase SETDB1-A isoform X2 [Drosophila innubila]